jgi:hypothetical protein
VLDQRQLDPLALMKSPHGPDIGSGEAGHPVEIIDRRPGAWAGDDAPGGSPRHGWCQEQGD